MANHDGIMARTTNAKENPGSNGGKIYKEAESGNTESRSVGYGYGGLLSQVKDLFEMLLFE